MTFIVPVVWIFDQLGPKIVYKPDVSNSSNIASILWKFCDDCGNSATVY